MPQTLTLVTRDVDEAAALSSGLFYASRLSPIAAHDTFFMSFFGVRFGAVTIGNLQFGCSMRLDMGGLDTSYGVSIPGSGCVRLSAGRQEFETTSSTAAVRSPIDSMRAAGWSSAGEWLTSIKFERGFAEAELTRMLGTSPRGPIRFAPFLDARKGRGAEWLSLVRMIGGSARSNDALITNPYYAAHMSTTLVRGLILACNHQFHDSLEQARGRVQPAIIRRAVAIMEEKAEQPISISDVASLLGVSERTLQRGFRDHLGTTPGRYLARVRMDGAHRDLLAASPETRTVSMIASKWGFFHDGRFAARYRETYGQNPSVTLGTS